MELILATIAVLLVALLVIRDAEHGGRRQHPSEPSAAHPLPTTGSAPGQPASVRPTTPIAPNIVPAGATLALEDDEELVHVPLNGNEPAPIGVPHLRPDPARFIQTEVLEPVKPAEPVFATIKLLAAVTAYGVLAGGLIILTGRGIGYLIERFAG